MSTSDLYNAAVISVLFPPPTVPKKCRLRTVCVVHWRRLSCVFLFAVS